MNENKTNSIIKVQQLTLSLLKQYIKICEENNLRYYVAGGALIGAFRHGGFIPWDDDVDVIMPRADYNRFVELAMKEQTDGYSICNRYTDPNWHFAMSQFIDLQSKVEINLAEKPRSSYVWIDVFPIDGLPDNRFMRWLRVKKVLFYRYLIQIAHIKTQVDATRQRPWYERFILWLLTIIPLGRMINTKKVLNKIEKTLEKNDFDTSKYAGDLLGRYREKEIMPQSVFGKAKSHEFEGITVSIPANSDYFLKQIYGDYMKLPPEQERIAHGVKIIKSRIELL